MPQFGAWTKDYYLATPPMGLATGRTNYAIKSIQRELAYNDFPTVMVDGIFGPGTRARVIDYQRKHSLKADGIVGPITARSLCQNRIFTYSNNVSVNPRLTAGIIRVESGYDFGAVGFVDHHDRGLAQINSIEHAEVPDSSAYDSTFAITFVVQTIRAALRIFQDDECAIASYNLGLAGATAWCMNKGSNVAAIAYVANVLEGA